MSDVGSGVNLVISANASNFSAAVTKVNGQLKQLGNNAKEASGHTVSGMQAASASIRLLDNPLGNNVRAIERLISQSKVLSSVLKAAFPLVGAIAIGAMIAKLGKEVADFIQKVNAMPRAIKEGFDALNLSQKTTTDELTVTNDKLAESIAKLEHKPVNNAKTAMDELTLSADKAAEHIVSANAKLSELLSKNHLSGLAVLLGKVGTGDRENAAKKFGSQADDAAYDLANATTPDQTRAAQAKLKAVQDAQLAEARKDLAQRQAIASGPESSHTDDSANMTIDKGVITTILNQRKQEQAELDNAALESQKDKDETAKTAAEQAKAAARAALEAQKKAAAEQLQQWESDNSDWKAVQDRSLSEDTAWWKAKLNTLNTGSLNYKAVNKKVNADIIADNREWAKQLAEAQEGYLKDGNSRDWLSKSDSDYLENSSNSNTKAATEWFNNVSKGNTIQRENQDGLSQASLDMALATGQITQLDAATVRTTLHTQEYTESLKQLQQARQEILNDGDLTDLQRKAKLSENDNSQSSLTGAYTVQHQVDMNSQNPASSLASVGFVDALNDFTNASKDAAGQMRELVTGSLHSVNEEILKAMSGQRTSFGAAGAGIARNVAGVALNKAEGSVLSAFGFGGKPDGSQSKPLYVKIADRVGGAAGSAGSWLSKLFGGSGGGSASSGSQQGGGGLLGGLGGIVSTALPFLASGGPLSANTMAVVGERGPELFVPSTSGHVIPNHALGSIGSSSGDTTHHWHIDARGATDPAQVRAQVMQGIAEAAPHIIAASQRAQQETKRRSSPSSQR